MGSFGTLSLPLVELSKPSPQMKLQMKSFGLAKLFKMALVCDVHKGRKPHASLHKTGAALKLAQRTLNAAEQLGSADHSLCPKELRLKRLLQPRKSTHFFGSDWYLLEMPCLPNKLTSFCNLCLLWSNDCCLLIGQKLSRFSTCVTWTWGDFKVLIIWVFHIVFFSFSPFSLLLWSDQFCSHFPISLVSPSVMRIPRADTLCDMLWQAVTTL